MQGIKMKPGGPTFEGDKNLVEGTAKLDKLEGQLREIRARYESARAAATHNDDAVSVAAKALLDGTVYTAPPTPAEVAALHRDMQVIETARDMQIEIVNRRRGEVARAVREHRLPEHRELCRRLAASVESLLESIRAKKR
jgi:hypothetical protein